MLLISLSHFCKKDFNKCTVFLFGHNPIRTGETIVYSFLSVLKCFNALVSKEIDFILCVCLFWNCSLLNFENKELN